MKKTDQELMDEHCASVSYDKTPRNWRNDSRTAEDPDDAQEVKPVKPALTVPPKAQRGN